MKLITLLIAVLFISMLYSSCSKKEPEPPEPPQLTPMTTTGAETLSFLKDGEVWIADKDALSPLATIALGSKQFSVNSSMKWPINQKEIFNWSFPLVDYSIRKYFEDSGIGAGFFPVVDSSEYCNPILEPSAEYLSLAFDMLDTFNYVNISHIDQSGNFNIISGTFQMRMVNVENEECQDTIYITDRRFDLEFDVLP